MYVGDGLHLAINTEAGYTPAQLQLWKYPLLQPTVPEVLKTGPHERGSQGSFDRYCVDCRSSAIFRV